jgi:DNA-binding PucR family transcriptional regulator
LRATLQSWLDFRGMAWRQLKIHRNTLLDRIRRIETILGRDLSRLSVQAELHLALRLLSRAGDDLAGAAPELDELLAEPAVRKWAEMMLAPLAGEAGPPLLDTVRAWLAAGTRPEATAAALGISARAVHRRLVRAEQRLGRSLLGGPSARHDVLMALRIRDGIAPGS